ncbi:hypothetical protein Nepgr_018795 [Nepenthes gracilis]|uniref:Uncharacterized protein n=1 Tax=Nepenthes gracilis TaxID=150966 RepID=A0AAD3SUI4_NEPGR|nr:hypothetical protein Nepgr_018795 [Nepenthes gracilis]
MVSLLPDDKAEESHEDPVLKELEDLQVASCSRIPLVSRLMCNIASPVRRDAICLRDAVSSEDVSIDLRGSSSSGEYVSSFHDLQEDDQDMDVPYVDGVESKMAMIEAWTKEFLYPVEGKRILIATSSHLLKLLMLHYYDVGAIGDAGGGS